MAGLLQDQGKLSDAEALYREALDGRRRTLGDAHPGTLNSINNMAGLLQDQGKLSDAEALYREALDGRRRTLGDAHPDTLGSINNMAVMLKAQGKLSDAEALYREALDGLRRTLGDAHPGMLRSINGLASVLRAQGKLADAIDFVRDARVWCLHPGLALALAHMLGDDAPERAALLSEGCVLLGHPHPLAHVSTMSTHQCDGCGAPPIFSCAPCGYDLCAACKTL